MTEEMFLEITAWQDKTFKKSTALSAAKHLHEEVDELIKEIERDGDVAHEFADCFMLLFASAHKAGLTYDSICRIINGKWEINKERKWGEPNEKGYVKHIEPITP